MCTKVRKINLFPVCSGVFSSLRPVSRFRLPPSGTSFAVSVSGACAASVRRVVAGSDSAGQRWAGPVRRCRGPVRRSSARLSGPVPCTGGADFAARARSPGAETSGPGIAPSSRAGRTQQGDGASGTSVRGAGERFPCGAVREPFAAVPKKRPAPSCAVVLACRAAVRQGAGVFSTGIRPLRVFGRCGSSGRENGKAGTKIFNKI